MIINQTYDILEKVEEHLDEVYDLLDEHEKKKAKKLPKRFCARVEKLKDDALNLQTDCEVLQEDLEVYEVNLKPNRRKK